MKLSKLQEDALAIALGIGSASKLEDKLLARRLKLLLLRAFVIYQRHQQLPPARLSKYQEDFQNRLKQYYLLIKETSLVRKSSNNFFPIPFYLFIFLQANLTSNIFLDNQFVFSQESCQFLTKKTSTQIILFKKYLAIVIKNPKIIRLKEKLGCISCILIKINERYLKVRGVCIHYHDLYHLEVAQLERIRIGEYWISGIHGINSRVFHPTPLEQEYDSFFDEARVAIHEWLTRPTLFSLLKMFCWTLFLILQGINPLAVGIRHLNSMQKKQKELIERLKFV